MFKINPKIPRYKKSLKIQRGVGVIRIYKSKKNRQHNGQKNKDKQRSTKHTHKTKDGETRTPPLKIGMLPHTNGKFTM